MTESIHGFVFHVTRFVNGHIELDFFDIDKNEKVTYSTERELPVDIARALSDSLGRNIWTKIDLDNKTIVSVSFEEYNFANDIYKLREKLDKVWPGYLERSPGFCTQTDDSNSASQE